MQTTDGKTSMKYREHTSNFRLSSTFVYFSLLLQSLYIPVMVFFVPLDTDLVHSQTEPAVSSSNCHDIGGIPMFLLQCCLCASSSREIQLRLLTSLAHQRQSS